MYTVITLGVITQILQERKNSTTDVGCCGQNQSGVLHAHVCDKKPHNIQIELLT